MKKTLKATIIITVMLLAMVIAAVPASVSAYSKVESVDINKSAVTTKAGAHVGLKVAVSYVGEQPDTKNIEWKSSNNSVATVKNGTVVAKKAGKATITADLEGEEDTCVVTVKSTPAKYVNAKGCYGQLNKYRKAVKAKGLKKDKKLEKIAKIRAKEMAMSGKFSHTRPNGKSGLTLIKGNKYKGENIAMGQKTCAQVSVAWFKSPGHKKNMLKKQYKKVGIAGYEYNGVIYWAQVFSS